MAREASAVEDNSCLVQARWEWSARETDGRWSSFHEVIRQRPIMEDFDSDDDQPQVRFSKIKVRGRGRALVLRFESVAGKDFQLLGWSVPFTASTVA